MKYYLQNYHYKNWKDWYGRIQSENQSTTEGLTNVLHYRDGEENRKIGYTLWNLINHGQPYVFQEKANNAVFDLSVRNEKGKITGYETFYDGDHWWGIYLNEVKIYPFYMNLFKTDWSQR